jgi:hypothetical protein
MRWKDYVLARGKADFEAFWKAHATENGRKLLFIVGRGFDPRASMGLVQLREAAPNCPIDVIGLDYKDEFSTSSLEHRKSAEENWDKITSAMSSLGAASVRAINFRSEDGRRVAARNSADLFADSEELAKYTDVVIDISAMPRVVYFPLVSRLMFFHDELTETGKAPNIHVLVSEDPKLDSVIREYGVDETAAYLHPFEGPFIQESKGGQPAIWIPVLGEGRTIQFERIHELLKAQEVCPILPSPARNPRRADDIVMEYQELLFDQLHVDPRNFIYASELNPFDVYRQVRRAALHYHEVLSLIGGCRVALSALCGKVMSVGILLVAYELKATEIQSGIAHIECQSYDIPNETPIDIEPVSIWVAGECYEKA